MPDRPEEFTKFAGKYPIKRAKSLKPPTSLEEYGAAEIAVEEALRGNFALLVNRLRTAPVLLSIERDVAADIIDKKLGKPGHRPRNPGTSNKAWLLAFEVAELMHAGNPEKSAVSMVAETAKVSTSSVRKAMKQHPGVLEGLGIKSRT
jgi:hypothetical protein